MKTIDRDSLSFFFLLTFYFKEKHDSCIQTNKKNFVNCSALLSFFLPDIPSSYHFFPLLTYIIAPRSILLSSETKSNLDKLLAKKISSKYYLYMVCLDFIMKTLSITTYYN